MMILRSVLHLCKPTGNAPEKNYELLELFTESPGNRNIELADNMLPNNSKNVITNHIKLTKSLQLKQKTKRSQDKDNHFSINNLPNCAFNRGKQSVTHSVKKETPSNDQTLPDCLLNREKQSVAC